MLRRLALLATAIAAGAVPGAAVAAPAVAEYDLGLVQLPQDDAAFPRLPVHLQGVIAVPEGTSPAPVVVLLHGRDKSCRGTQVLDPWPCPDGTEIRNDLGLRYVVENLAAKGYVALAIDINAAYTLTAGTTTDQGLGRVREILRRQLVRLHDAGRGKANGFGVPLAGRVDLTHLGLVGHGKGGEAALNVGREYAGHPDPVAAAQIDGLVPVDAVLAVAPTFDTTTTSPPVDVPTATILPACDGKVLGLDGANYHDVARRAAGRASLAAVVLVRGANTTWFNDAQDEDDARFLKTPGCAAGDAGRLPRAGQRSFLASYAVVFFDHALRAAPPHAVIDPTQRPPSLFAGAKIVSWASAPAGQRVVLVEPRRRADVTKTAVGGPIVPIGKTTVTFCAPGRRCDPAMPQPSYPGALRVRWTKKGSSLRLGIPASAADQRTAVALALRIAVDPTAAENPAGRGQSLSIVLRDGSGRTARVVIPASEPALQYPIGRFSVLDGPWGHVPLGAVRIPLSQFGAIDRARLRAVSLTFDRTAKGAILLGGVELVAPPPPAAPAG